MHQSRPTHYARILAAIQAEPWFVDGRALEEVVQVLERRSAGIRLDDEEIQAAIEAKSRGRLEAVAPRGIAVLPIFGLLVQRASNLDTSERGTPVEWAVAQYKLAQDSPDVAAVILNFDTPGGSIHGIPEFSDVVAKYGGKDRKPVYAVANPRALSAGYMIAAQAHKIFVPIDGEVGSVGAKTIHVNKLKAVENEGLEVEVLTYPEGGNKDEFSSLGPLSEPSRKHLKGRLAEVGLLFERHVARGRRVNLSDVQESFGKGRVFGAKDALRLKMVDEIGTLQDAIDRLASRIGRGASVLAPDDRRIAAQDDDLPTFDAAAEKGRDTIYLADREVPLQPDLSTTPDNRTAEDTTMPDNPITEEGLRVLLKESAEGVRTSLNADVEKLLAPIKERAENAAKQAAETAEAMKLAQVASAEANATATRTAWDTQLGELERATKITQGERAIYLTAILAMPEDKDRAAFLATLSAREPKLSGNAVTALVIEENGQQVDLAGEFGEDVAGLHAGGAAAFAEGVRTFPGGLEASRKEPGKFAAHMDRITRGRPHWAVN